MRLLLSMFVVCVILGQVSCATWREQELPAGCKFVAPRPVFDAREAIGMTRAEIRDRWPHSYAICRGELILVWQDEQHYLAGWGP